MWICQPATVASNVPRQSTDTEAVTHARAISTLDGTVLTRPFPQPQHGLSVPVSATFLLSSKENTSIFEQPFLVRLHVTLSELHEALGLEPLQRPQLVLESAQQVGFLAFNGDHAFL